MAATANDIITLGIGPGSEILTFITTGLGIGAAAAVATLITTLQFSGEFVYNSTMLGEFTTSACILGSVS